MTSRKYKMASKKQKKTQTKQTQQGQLGQLYAGAAVALRDLPRIGMKDIRGHEISYLTGYVYVGNGTLGATDSVYFVDPTKTYTVTADSYGANVPIAPSDPYVGASYVKDVMKHYARVVIRKQTIAFLSLNPSTTNSMVVVAAAFRGAGNIGTITTDTTASATYTNIVSATGAKQFASWESGVMDATWAIAGGGGAQQNDFQIAAPIGLNTVNGSTEAYQGCISSTFQVSGNNSSTGLRGTVTHAVIVQLVVDLVDYVGGQIDIVPVGLDAAVPPVSRQSSRLTRSSCSKNVDAPGASRATGTGSDNSSAVETHAGDKSGLDVLASAAAKHGDRWDLLKRRLNDLPRDQQLELLATLSERL